MAPPVSETDVVPLEGPLESLGYFKKPAGEIVKTKRLRGLQSSGKQTKQRVAAGKSRRSPEFEPTAPKKARGEKLIKAKAASRRAQLEGLTLDDTAARKLLNKNLGSPPGSTKEWQAHHLVPYEHRGHPVIEDAYRDAGWEINDKNNGKYLPTAPTVQGAGTKAIHNQNHPKYNAMVKQRLDQFQQVGGTPEQKRAALEGLSKELSEKLELGEIKLQ